MTHVSRLTNRELREAADRLVWDRSDLPPGSVLRAFSRSVRTALLDGVPAAEVVAQAEDRTRELLDQRSSGPLHPRLRARAGGRGPAVPRPRRAG